MSLLNLSSPAGQSPRGKKGLKMLMGAGLVVAVLGIGSTFAASININNNDTSEFGQGVTQTVYCGDNPGGEPNIITVTPISAFVNSTSNPGSDAVPDTWTRATGIRGSFEEVDDSASDKRSYVRYQDPETGLYIENQPGYWIKARNSTKSDDVYDGRASATAPNNFPIFVPQVRERVTSGDYGYYPYTNWVDGFFSGGSPAVPASNTPDKFEFGGVKISDIPSACDGRDFVISAYGSGAEPLELSDVLNVTEVAVNYVSGDTTPLFSFDRTTPGVITGAGGKVEVSADTGSIKVLFTSAAVRQLADSVTKVVVETQAASID
jgi:hypothetical protein